MNMKLKKILDDIQKTEDKIAELQEHLKKRYTNNTATRMYYYLINIFDFAIKT